MCTWGSVQTEARTSRDLQLSRFSSFSKHPTHTSYTDIKAYYRELRRHRPSMSPNTPLA